MIKLMIQNKREGECGEGEETKRKLGAGIFIIFVTPPLWDGIEAKLIPDSYIEALKQVCD